MKNVENRNSIFKPVGAFIRPWWSHMSSRLKKSLCGLAIALCGLVSMQSCRVIQYVPIETGTSVNIKDSTVLHYIDSVRITERSIYKDYTGLLDTLGIKNDRASMRAWADTSKNLIVGELQTEPVEEKVKIVYKDRIEYRDSIRTEQVPVPVEVEKIKKVYPRWLVVLSILGVLSTAVLIFQIYLKIKKKFPL